MYSRDIFPKYSSGGMPIPENYSGNAIRRTPPRQSPPPRPASPQPHSAPRAAVPLTVSPSFTARQNPPDAAREQTVSAPRVENAEREERAEEARREIEEEQQTASASAHTEEKAETVATSASPSPARESGLSSLLSTFLPPKPGGGGIFSQIGLEEALLLGLFLLLSQSEEEEDTLMLLAVLFLYR